MRLSDTSAPSLHGNLAAGLALLLFPSFISAVTVDCKHIVVDKQNFNLSPLEGPNTVWEVTDHAPNRLNTTYTINPCNKLRRTKGVAKDKECPNGAHVCGIEHVLYDDGHLDEDPLGIKVIAGDFPTSHGLSLDAQWTRLSTSSSHADSEKEGLRLEMHGGRYPLKSSGKKQKAIVEFLCDRERTGLERGSGLGDGSKKDDEKEDEGEPEERRRRAEDDDDEEDGRHQTSNSDEKSLRLISYKEGETEDILRLEWRTKYACEGETDRKDGGSGNGHWGFFTWFIIIAFMGTAAYLIFGSWLNFTRYGARGWDLVPHGDTIRDVPYLLKDWGRRVVNTVQGGGSRGGYSAV
ncbi:MAG: hypothetical protein M4579_001664 [Chaenotheca gracillima]|nr:MAG: hypothetical protein M4579_001664 [Chaenotheca gracillima]